MALLFNKAYDPAHDCYASTVDDISNYYHVHSESQGGTFLDIVAPSAANYPDALAGTPSRYFIYFPMRIDRSDLSGSRPIVVEDETTATTLTRVTGTPSTNEYRIPPETSIRRNTVEIHSGQAGHTISYDYYGEASMYTAEEWNKKKWVNFYATTSDYTITDTDFYDEFHASHSSATGKITFTLPTAADNIGRKILFKNTGTGLTVIDGEGTESIHFRDNDLSDIRLFDEDDFIELLSDGSSIWRTERYSININIGWQNRSDWTTVHVGNGVTYDTKSAAEDWTGKKFSDGINLACCLYDSGSSSSTGILYFWDINTSSTGNFTNNDTLTANDADTVLVNEGSGSNKNIDYNLYHGSGVNHQKRSFYFNTSGSFTGAYRYDNSAGSGIYGMIFYVNDADQVKLQTGSGGVYTISDAGAANIINTNDIYCNTILEF